MDVGVKFRGFFDLDCNFPSWLVVFCAKPSILLFFQFFRLVSTWLVDLYHNLL